MTLRICTLLYFYFNFIFVIIILCFFSQNAVSALAGLCLARKLNNDPLGADAFCAALLALSEHGVLAHLLVSRLQQVVDELLVPLLVSVSVAGATDEEVEFVDTLLHLFERYVLPYNHHHSYLEACRAPIFAKLAHLSGNCAKILSKIFRDGKIDFPCPARHLLDEIPAIFHHLVLTSELSTAESSPVALLEGLLATALANCAKLLGVSIAESVPDSSCMSIVTFHHVLLPVVWSLGGASSTERTNGGTLWDHLRALQVLCTQASEPTWRQRRTTVAFTTETIDNNVSDKLQTDFLYIMANLLLKDWRAQSQGYQEQSLKCFNALIRLLKQSDLIKFLPKVQRRTEA